MRYLGRIIAADGYILNPNNIKAVKEFGMTKANNAGDVRRLLVMAGYFRKYIPNFSETTDPLYVLLKKSDDLSNSSIPLISWSETQQEALVQHLLCLVEPPILAYPDHNKEFILHVNVSCKTMGAILLE